MTDEWYLENTDKATTTKKINLPIEPIEGSNRWREITKWVYTYEDAVLDVLYTAIVSPDGLLDTDYAYAIDRS